MEEHKILAKLTEYEVEQMRMIANKESALTEIIDKLVDKQAEIRKQKDQWFDKVFEAHGIEKGTKVHCNLDDGVIREGWVK